ncbi:dUTP diphosphatase [Candidatus Paracaedibacter symbiosus]|uniref:dUTP diphosphatase n=1 Tax=Candidatus Paracaedibacter symbiosus TaxID=244582 RepID=UPI00050958A5|nr:dUTP diphosphatase [Candidatus Paracaedibacter symbiosus]
MLATQSKIIKTDSSDVVITIQKLPHGQDLPLPAYATRLSAGMDLLAAIEEPITLTPGMRHLIPSGIAIALPEGFEAQIRSRSGLALKHGVVVLNAPGTIDADYRGELKGIMVNHGSEPFIITPGMRFAQLVIAQVAHAEWNPVAILNDCQNTDRGAGGFGSTGL